MKKSVSIIMLFLPILAFAQPTIDRSTINAGGSYSEDGGVSLSSSIGEAVARTIETGTITLTQGFQQPAPKPLSVDIPEWNINIIAYPNPAESQIKVHLKHGGESPGLFTFELTDLSGKTLFRNAGVNVSSEHIEEIDMSDYVAGSYFINIIIKDIIKSIKVLKIE